MVSFYTIILIGISLSMDAFSLSLIYGMQKIKQFDKILLSLIVGIYHFIMPLIGYYFGNIITKINIININFLSSLILIYIGFDLIISNYIDKEEKIRINKIGFLIFGLSVSLDSLSVGIGLKAITNSHYISSIIFSILSFLFTYTGLYLGNSLGNKIGPYSKTLGGTILIIIAIILLLH